MMIGTLAGEIESFNVAAPIQNFVKLESERKSAPKVMVDNDSPEDDSEPVDISTEAWKGQEAEPNNDVKSAFAIRIPASIQGTVANVESNTSPSSDEDWYAFDAKANDTWLITASPETPTPLARSSGRSAGVMVLVKRKHRASIRMQVQTTPTPTR